MLPLGRRSHCPASTASPTSSRPWRSGCSTASRPRPSARRSRAFPGVEHRLELVATIDGVRYVNNSQGTQPDAVIAAVRAFPQPLVLIAGGRSKQVPIDDLARTVAERVSAAVLIGETADELASAFRAAGLEHVEQADSMACRGPPGDGHRSSARRPSIVLLSPAAASFDMFRDYEARGAAFKAAVAALAAEKGHDAAADVMGADVAAAQAAPEVSPL